MKLKTKKIILPLLLTAIIPLTGIAQAGRNLVIRNPLPIERGDELVVLHRCDLEKRIGKLEKFIQVKSGGKVVPIQFDDLNSDGQWDDAVFLYSFKAGESATFALLPAPAANTAILPRAHVRLRKRNANNGWGPNLKREEMPLRNPATDFSKQPLPLYLTEGPAWENDRVGFRLYFDVRNGKDIWGKRTSRMVLDSVGTQVEPSYHNLNDWGMDLLKVGPSLGAGGLALSVKADQEDTLIRLGGQHITRTRYEQVADGPLRALFRIYYEWVIYGSPVQVVEEVCIWGGQEFYESRVQVLGAPEGTRLISGIPDLYPNQFQAFEAGGSMVLLTHGRQSENKDHLGMAIVVPKGQMVFVGSAPASGSDVMNTYLMAQEVASKKPVRFRFYAGWEDSDKRFTHFESSKQVMVDEARKWNSPVLLKW